MRRPPNLERGSSQRSSDDMIVRHWQATIKYVLMFLNLNARYGAPSSIQPMMNPYGIRNNKELSELNPKLWTMMAWKVDCGPLAICMRKPIAKISQNLM